LNHFPQRTDEGSSPENSPIQQPTNQRQNNGQMGNNIVEQRQGNNASGHGQQHEAIVKEMTPLQKYMMPNSPYTTVNHTQNIINFNILHHF
jgi:hypothetical protein